MLNRSIKFLIENKLVAVLLLFLFVVWGLINAPFNTEIIGLPKDPVAVDAIPDIVKISKLYLLSGQEGRHKTLKTKLPIRLPHRC